MYYLLFPLFVVPFVGDRAGRRARLPLLIVGVAVFFAMTALNKSMAWLFLPWCLGAFARVAVAWPVIANRIPPERLCWALTLVLVLLFPWVPGFIRPVVTLSIGVSIAAALLAANRAQVLPWRNGRLIRRGSDFSFSLYVVHVPVLNFLVTMGRGQADPFIGVDPFSLAAPGLIAFLTGIVCLIAFIFALLTERHTGWLRRKIDETFTERRTFTPRVTE